MLPKKPRKIRQILLAIRGKQRKPRRVPRAEWADAMIDSREWWLVEAMDTTMARQLVARWPYIHALPDGITKIINHRKIPR